MKRSKLIALATVISFSLTNSAFATGKPSNSGNGHNVNNGSHNNNTNGNANNNANNNANHNVNNNTANSNSDANSNSSAYNQNNISNTNAQGQAQGQEQGQSQNQSASSDQSQSQSANNQNTVGNSNVIDVEVQGDSTLIHYDVAASSAAPVFAGNCQYGGSFSTVPVGGAVVQMDEFCQLMTEAQAYLDLAHTKWNHVLNDFEPTNAAIYSYIFQIEERIMALEDDMFGYKGAAKKFTRLYTTKEKVEDIRHLTELRLKWRSNLKSYEIYHADMALEVIENMKKAEELMEKAGIKVQRTGITGFIAKISTQLIAPLGIFALVKAL